MSEQTPSRRLLPKRSFLVACACGVVYGLALRLALTVLSPPPGLAVSMPHAAGVMLNSFLVLGPFVAGMLMVYLERHHMTWARAIYHPWVPMLLMLGICVVFVFEGLICVLLAAPVFLCASSIGGLIMYAVLRWWTPSGGTMSALLVLPLLLGVGERRLPLPVAVPSVARSLYIAEPTSTVWGVINDARGIRPEELRGGVAWRIGVPYPVQGRTEADATGLVRRVEWQRHVHFDEPILAWKKDRYVRWSYRFAPDSVPAEALDEHVRIGGTYFGLVDTAYALRPEGGGTRLSILVRYRVSTPFNWYARPLARWLVADAANSLLGFYRSRSEKAAAVAALAER